MPTSFITRAVFISITIALAVPATIAPIEFVNAQTPPPASPAKSDQAQPQSPTPAPASTPNTPAPAATCRTPADEAERDKLKADLAALQETVQGIVNEIAALEAEQSNANKDAEHFKQVGERKEDLTPDEVEGNIVPSAAEATARATSASLTVAIARKNAELQSKIDQSKPITARLNALDKLKPCPITPPVTVLIPPPEPQPQAPPASGPKPADATGCRTAEDEAKLRELKRIIVFTEKEIVDTEALQKKTDIDIDATLSDDRMDANLRKERVERFKELKASLDVKLTNDRKTLEEFKAAANAILAKPPCPPPEKLAVPVPPGVVPPPTVVLPPAVALPPAAALPPSGQPRKESRDNRHPKKPVESKTTNRERHGSRPVAAQSGNAASQPAISIDIGIGGGFGRRTGDRRIERGDSLKSRRDGNRRGDFGGVGGGGMTFGR
jgi:hypothetical protein